MTWVLSDVWIMSDRCGKCQWSWRHLQLHSRHTHISPWFSDRQASTLYLNQVMWWSKEDHIGLDILSYYAMSVELCMEYVWYLWYMLMIMASAWTTPQTCSAITLICFWSASFKTASQPGDEVIQRGSYNYGYTITLWQEYWIMHA